MKRPCVLLIAAAMLLCGNLFAQTTPPSQSPKQTATNDFSGMYSFLQDGEFVQITVEDQGKVSGFVSRYGELESDKGAFLDQFFKSGSTDGQQIGFVTQPVHGTWYEFQGNVSRGPGKTPNEEGYFVIKGKLTKYNTDAAKKTSAQSRDVTLKSFPQDAGMDTQKRD